MSGKIPKVSSLKTAELFQNRIKELGIDLPFDPEATFCPDSILGTSIKSQRHEIGNRFCILPMEGWDGTKDGKPTELTVRRWENFGKSGAKLIWGGEAVAVRPDGKANPNQLLINDANLSSLEELRQSLIACHKKALGLNPESEVSDLSIGLQLTHSGRFARPNEKTKLESRTAYTHPVLDPQFSCDQGNVMSDDELKGLIEDFIQAAIWAQKAGYRWVDVKHCHGYLGHEILSGYDREGEFGGCFENRTRFLREVVAGIRANCPGLEIGVRLSIFDFVPFRPGEDRIGVPASDGPYVPAFGGDGTGKGIDLEEPIRFANLLKDLGIDLLCSTAGSPYYNPHIQRPAAFPPSDGYLPPEDPLVGVARQIQATAELKKQFPELVVVGSGYTYLQDWLPHVGAKVIASSMADSIGLGRMVLSYPELPLDVLTGGQMKRKKICRTFSDCTTAPRNGMVSGCYPLDPFYKARPEFVQLKEKKKELRS